MNFEKLNSSNPGCAPAHTGSGYRTAVWCPGDQVYEPGVGCVPPPPQCEYGPAYWFGGEWLCPEPTNCQLLAGQGVTPPRWHGSTPNGPMPFYACDSASGCGIAAYDRDMCFSYSTNWACTYRTARYTGNSCATDGTGDGTSEENPSSDVDPPDVPEPCPPGQAPGIVNGVQGCYPAGNQGPASSGSSSSETTTTSDGGNTTTTTQRNTTCEGGVCTTTTTTTVTNNNTQQTTTETNTRTEPRSAFCQSNPRDSLCGGSGNGDGDGDGDGETAPIGELYAKKDETFQAVLSRHRDALLATGIGSAVGGFFNVSGGGSCPTYTANIPYIDATVTFDQLCTAFASDALSIMRIAVLLVFGFFAFRIAVE